MILLLELLELLELLGFVTARLEEASPTTTVCTTAVTVVCSLQDYKLLVVILLQIQPAASNTTVYH